MISLTMDVVILPKAAPMTTPMAISITLPRMAKVLNSLKNFFTGQLSYTDSIMRDKYSELLSKIVQWRGTRRSLPPM